MGAICPTLNPMKSEYVARESSCPNVSFLPLLVGACLSYRVIQASRLDWKDKLICASFVLTAGIIVSIAIEHLCKSPH